MECELLQSPVISLLYNTTVLYDKFQKVQSLILDVQQFEHN